MRLRRKRWTVSDLECVLPQSFPWENSWKELFQSSSPHFPQINEWFSWLILVFIFQVMRWCKMSELASQPDFCPVSPHPESTFYLHKQAGNEHQLLWREGLTLWSGKQNSSFCLESMAKCILKMRHGGNVSSRWELLCKPLSQRLLAGCRVKVRA